MSSPPWNIWAMPQKPVMISGRFPREARALMHPRLKRRRAYKNKDALQGSQSRHALNSGNKKPLVVECRKEFMHVWTCKHIVGRYFVPVGPNGIVRAWCLMFEGACAPRVQQKEVAKQSYLDHTRRNSIILTLQEWQGTFPTPHPCEHYP